MKRNFRKGLAIFLILCLLVNGAVGHDCSANPKLREDFGSCARINEAKGVFDLESKWFAVNDTDNDVVIRHNWIGVASTGVCYDRINNVYRWSAGPKFNLPRLTYFAGYKLWYDQGERIYFDAKTGFFYTPPLSTCNARGVYGYLDTDEMIAYEKPLKAALTDIQRFEARMKDVAWAYFKNALNDKPIRTWELPW